MLHKRSAIYIRYHCDTRDTLSSIQQTNPYNLPDHHGVRPVFRKTYQTPISHHHTKNYSVEFHKSSLHLPCSLASSPKINLLQFGQQHQFHQYASPVCLSTIHTKSSYFRAKPQLTSGLSSDDVKTTNCIPYITPHTTHRISCRTLELQLLFSSLGTLNAFL